MAEHNNDDKQNEWQESGQPDRRNEHRRSGDDRRDMIRFELDKDDRRKGKDRRKDKNSGWDTGTTI